MDFLSLANWLIFDSLSLHRDSYKPLPNHYYFFLSSPPSPNHNILPFEISYQSPFFALFFIFTFLNMWLILKTCSLQFILQTGSCRTVSSNHSLFFIFMVSDVSFQYMPEHVTQDTNNVWNLHSSLLNHYFQLDIPVYISAFTKVLNCTCSSSVSLTSLS